MTYKNYSLTFAALGFVLSVGSLLSADILAYEGFAADATGSGANYEENTILQFIDKTRTGFTGDWYDSDAGISSNVNSRSLSGGLSYANYAGGTPGMAEPFRDAGIAGTGKVLSRSLAPISSTVLDSSGKYYFSALIDFNSAPGGGVGFASAGSRDNDFIYDGSLVTFQSGGNSGQSTTFTPMAGTNLVVVEYTNDTTGNGSLSNAYYTRWNLYVNPDLSDGNLSGDLTATGFGIGFLENTATAGPSDLRLNMNNLAAGDSVFVDEVYFTTDASDFILIPEPTSLLLLLGAGLAILVFRKRS